MPRPRPPGIETYARRAARRGRVAPADTVAESDARFRLLVEGIRDYGIIMLDPDGRIVSWNTGAQNIEGYTEQEIVGRHFSILYPPDAVARGYPERELRMAREQGRVEDEGWRVRKDGSTFWAAVIVTALRDARGDLQGYAKVTRDTTERRRIEALEETSREMNNFLAMLAHELRNPLAPIRNAIAVMRLRSFGDPRLEWCRDVVDRQVAHLSRLVDDLLDVSRITSGKIVLDVERLEMAQVVARAVEASTPLIEERKHDFEVVLPREPVFVSGDVTRLSQVLLNLLNNAAKYTPSGGRITLSFSQEEGEAVVRVRDTGIGIPADLLPKIFDIFIQGERSLDRTEGGLGLGLALVRKIVELHHGRVEARSGGPGAGSEFVVRLPLAAAPAPRTNAQSAAMLTAPARTIRILVVDDNRDSADSMTVLLELHGHEVRCAYDGPSALALAAEFEPEIVLLDIGLPKMSGFEVAQRLRAIPRLAHSRLIAMTGYGQAEDRNRAAQSGFDDHLIKPVDLPALEALLQAYDAKRGLGGAT
jgi:PAS domain S-box-containing protein